MPLDHAVDPEAFRQEVREFLRTELPPALVAAYRRSSAVVPDPEIGREWQRILNRRGWGAPHWPAAFGGTDWTPAQHYIFETECANADTPPVSPFGPRMIGPVLIRFGRPDQQQRFLPRILAAEDQWCQGYSEPGAGSDLASLKTRAVRDGDDYVVTGTKIWTSSAHVADWMFALVRTNDQGKPQEGISFLLIDMRSPGVSVRPILLIGGDHEINQVFLDEVRVPVANRVGEENQGWTIAKYLLEHERGGGLAGVRFRRAVQRLRRLAAEEEAGGGRLTDDPAFHARLVQAELEALTLEAMEARLMAEAERTGRIGTGASPVMVKRGEVRQLVTELTVEAAGLYALPWGTPRGDTNEAPVGPDWAAPAAAAYLNARATTIFGGSAEVQREIIAKQILGL